jgi:hypothetical protein
MKRTWHSTVVALLILVFLGCTSYQGGMQAQHSGFLADYPEFSEGKDGVDRVWIKPGVDWKPYNKIMLDQVVFYFSEGSEYKGLTSEEVAELSEAYHKAFFDALQPGGYVFVSEPGPGVLRVRSAVTGLEKSSPVANTFSTVVPVGMAVNILAKGATGENISVGNCTAEGEFLDAVSGERLAAFVDFRPGGKLEGFSGIGPAKAAFEFWAKRLRARLDEMRGVKAAQ